MSVCSVYLSRQDLEESGGNPALNAPRLSMLQRQLMSLAVCLFTFKGHHPAAV